MVGTPTSPAGEPMSPVGEVSPTVLGDADSDEMPTLVATEKTQFENDEYDDESEEVKTMMMEIPTIPRPSMPTAVITQKTNDDRSGKEITKVGSTKESNVEKKKKRKTIESEADSMNPEKKPNTLDDGAIIWDADTVVQGCPALFSSGPTTWVGAAPKTYRPRPPPPGKLIPTNEFERRIRRQRDKKNARDSDRKKRRAAEKNQNLTYV